MNVSHTMGYTGKTYDIVSNGFLVTGVTTVSGLGLLVDKDDLTNHQTC